MIREIALHCMKSYSELHSDLCELCPIYGQTGNDHCFEDALEYVIKDLEQEPKTGHWIKSNIGGAKVCSVCNAHMGLSSFKFCPSCGAKMVEPQESEDKS